MPGLPSGLVTLNQYLSGNQPAIDATQAALDKRNTDPYLAALANSQNTVNQMGQQANANAQTQAQNVTQRRADLYADEKSRNPNARMPAPGTASGTTTPMNAPGAAGTIQTSQAALDASTEEAKASADPGRRQDQLYSMYGASAPGGYGLGASGLDAALTHGTTLPSTAGVVQGMANTAAPTPYAATPAQPQTQPTQGVVGGPTGRGQVQKPRRDDLP